MVAADDDLHDAGLEHPLDALPHGGLGEPDRLGDGGIGLPAILLEQLDDLLRDVIEPGLRRGPLGPVGACHRAIVSLN